MMASTFLATTGPHNTIRCNSSLDGNVVMNLFGSFSSTIHVVLWAGSRRSSSTVTWAAGPQSWNLMWPSQLPLCCQLMLSRIALSGKWDIIKTKPFHCIATQNHCRFGTLLIWAYICDMLITVTHTTTNNHDALSKNMAFCQTPKAVRFFFAVGCP